MAKSLDIEKAKAELDKVEKILRKMEDYVPPEDVKKAKNWVWNASLDKYLEGIVGLQYGEDQRKKDRQRLIPLKTALDVLAKLEDDLVSTSVTGPYAQLRKFVTSKYNTAVNAAKGVWEGIKILWEFGLGDLYDAISVAVFHLVELWTVQMLKDQLAAVVGVTAVAVEEMRAKPLAQPDSERIWRRTRHRRK